MYAQQLGFASSWKMLTRDKGWVKPLLVLALVGWIPIVGQIAILGYGLEWARLTAWGVDAAPKQHDVVYGKVLSTGGIAFLITVTMGIVLGIIDVLLFGGWYPIAAFPMGIGVFSTSLIDLATEASIVVAPVVLVINLLMGTFTTAAMMRATIYDSFSAGWRIDRLFQMIGRDIGGFLHAYAVSLIGGIVSAVYSVVIAILGGAITIGGVMSIALSTGLAGEDVAGRVMYSAGPGFAVLAIVAVIAVVFVGNAISTTTQLLAINAMGQWFCRFDISRWGVSSAPLPDGVPVTWTDAAPVQPGAQTASAQTAAQQPWGGAQPQQPGAAPVATAEPVAVPVETAVDPGLDSNPTEVVGGASQQEPPVADTPHEPVAMGPVSAEAEEQAPDSSAADAAADAAAEEPANPEPFASEPAPEGPIEADGRDR